MVPFGTLTGKDPNPFNHYLRWEDSTYKAEHSCNLLFCFFFFFFFLKKKKKKMKMTLWSYTKQEALFTLKYSFLISPGTT